MIFEKLRSAEMNSHSSDQDYIIQRSMWIVKRNAIGYYTMIILGVIMIFQLPLAFGYDKLILAGWFPFDTTNTTSNFVLTYAWQEIGT